MPSTPGLSRSRSFAILIVGSLVGALALLVLGPRPAPLGAPSGDPALIADARDALAPGTALGAVSVVRLRDDVASWAGFGEVTPQSRFEIGSVTKTFSGLLLADAAERGEATLNDRLEAHLPELAGTPAGSVTLGALATHHSGLPAMAPHDGLLILAEDLAGAPYTAYTSATTDELIAATRAVPVTTRGSYAYSNLGMSLLGHALARAAGAADYPALVQERLFEPLGMDDAHIAAHGQPHPDTRQPHQPGGLPTAMSTSSGYAPAGIGVTLTASDLTAYARALLAGTAPGMDALIPRADGPLGQRIGLAWVVAGPASEVVWHNGRTAGSTAMFALDRAAGTAAVVTTNRWAEVTGAGLALLGLADVMPAIPVVDPDTIAWVAVALVLVPVFALGAVLGRSRTRIGGQGLAAVGALVLWVLAAPWSWVPAWVFGILAGLTVGAAVVAVLRWRDLPWLPEKRAWLAVLAGVLGVAWFGAMLALTGWVATLRP